jgi:hypothetical protein
MQPILVHNVANFDQKQAVFCGIPAKDMPSSKTGYLTDSKNVYPYDSVEGGIWFFGSFPAKTTVKLELSDLERKPQDFEWHPSIGSNLLALMPQFFLGAERAPTPMIAGVEQTDIQQTWHFRTVFANARVTVDFWARVASGHSTIEFVCEATYGNTRNDGQAQSVILPKLEMRSSGELVSDFGFRNGTQQTEPNCVQIASVGSRWHRASRWQVRGAIMPQQDIGRLQGKILYGLYTGWEGKWMALGKIPMATPDTLGLRASQYREYMNPGYGVYSAPRSRVQQRVSSTTGEQNDFGCASDLAVTTKEPWEIHDALWQCQGYAIRPTGNKEPDGSPMLASLHPEAELLNQRPDLSYGQTDRLGWPGVNQIEWIPSENTVMWSTSDDEHRSDNFLHATYALTRDPAIKQLIEDHVELDRLDVYIKRKLLSSARAIGRMALTRANQVWLGFQDAAITLCSGLDTVFQKRPMPAPGLIWTINGDGLAKYGWFDYNGSPVIGWQPWQEAIAMIGFQAAGNVMQHSIYWHAAKLLAEATMKQGILDNQTSFLHAYAVRKNYGQIFPRSSWPTIMGPNGEASNEDIYVSGACLPWTMAAFQLACDDHILNLVGKPRTVAEARWRAI